MAEREHPEAKRTSEWRKAFWSLVNKDTGGASVPSALTEEERQKSWQQLDEYEDGVGEGSSRDATPETTPTVDDSDTPSLPADVAAKLDSEAALHWDNFYSHFEDRFFKDRAYLRREFADLFALVDAPRSSEAPPVELLEIGCGAGNTAIPLAQSTGGKANLHAFDFSAKAVEVMRAREGFDAAHIHAFVCDVTDPEALAANVVPGTINFAMAVFALSAVSPAKLPMAFAAIHRALAPGGTLFVRDYGLHDMTQLRFVAKGERKLEDNFYVRADQTRVLFFSKAEAERLARDAGFDVAWVRYDTRVLRNRKREISMKRIWLTAKFIKPLPEAPQPKQQKQ